MPRFRSVHRRMLALVLGALLGLSGAEAGLRLLGWTPRYVFPVRGNHPRFHHIHRAHHVAVGRDPDDLGPMRVTTNDQGFRDAAWRTRKAPNTRRIAFIGDSFGWGICDDADTIPVHLAKSLSERSPESEFEVLNFSQVSFSPLPALLVIRDLAFNYHPDLVILLVNPSDPSDDYRYAQVTKFDPQGFPVACDGLRYGHRRGGLKLWQWLQDRFIPEELTPDPGDPTDVRGLENQLSYLRDDLMVDWSAHFERSNRYIGQLAALCRRRGIAFVVGSFPLAPTIDPDGWAAQREHFGFVRGRLYPDPYLKSLANFCARESIAFVDAGDELRPFVGREKLYWDHDPHFTSQGNAHVAQALATRVLDLPAGQDPHGSER